MRTCASALLLVVLAVPSAAQTPADARWGSWLGCWELAVENVRDGVAAPALRDRSSSTPGTAGGDSRPRVCVTAAADGGATFTTTIANETALEQTIVANGVDRAVDDADCRGTQRADWSADGTRLYANARLTCAQDASPRRVSGIAMLAPDGTWLDVQAVEVGGRENIRLRRYRRVAGSTPSPGAPVATPLTLGDVKEASSRISPRAIEAALVETRASFNLSSARLIELDDAGVAPSVVDVIVALSYPDRFVVERTRDDRASVIFTADPFFLDFGFFSPLSDLSYSPYYYSPFAYSYLGRFSPGAFGGGGYVIVDGVGGGGGSPSPQPSGDGRVVDGLGYTRVRSRDGAAAASDGQRSTSGAGDPTPAPAASSGSSGGASSQGSSSGSSGGDTGRTAVPR